MYSLERIIGGVVRPKAVGWAGYLNATAADGATATLVDAQVSGRPSAKGYERVVDEHQLEKISPGRRRE